MKITSVRAVYPKYRSVPQSWRTNLWQIVVRVETDSGVTGWGFGGGGKAAVEVVNGHLAELLAGGSLDSLADIESHWDRLYFESIPYGRKGVAVMAISGIDLALHDALAKAEGVSVARLLGDRPRTRLRAYATGPDTEWYAELGFTAQKISAKWTGPESEQPLVQAAAMARETLGPDAEVMFDVYMSWDADITRRLAGALRPYRAHWFEDVLTPDDLGELASLRPQIAPVLMAGGEHEFTHFGFEEIARVGAYDVWQPDITWCGGITAGRRIVELGRKHGVQVVPHRGGEVWGLHLIAATECEDFAELVMGQRDATRDELWPGEPEVTDGCVNVPDGPGFGVEPNEAMF